MPTEASRSSTSPRRPTMPARRHVVVTIGIDRYEHIPKLECAVNDATRVQEMLVRQFGFIAPLPPLLDERATQKAIVQLVRDDLPQILRPDDALLLFFAGHGTSREHAHAPATGYLAPVEASFPLRFSELVDMEHLLGDISRLNAHHILVILDCCKSGMALEAMKVYRDIPRYAVDLDRRRSRKVLTSAGPKQLALDVGSIDGNSLFTGILLEGLAQGLADFDRNGIISSAELALYVQQRVGQKCGSAQTPEYGSFHFDDRGELLFFLPNKSSAEADDVPSVVSGPTRTLTVDPTQSLLPSLANEHHAGVALIADNEENLDTTIADVLRLLDRQGAALVPIQLVPRPGTDDEDALYGRWLEDLERALPPAWRDVFQDQRHAQPADRFEWILEELCDGPLKRERRRLVLVLDAFAGITRPLRSSFGQRMARLVGERLAIFAWGGSEIEDLTQDSSSAFHKLTIERCVT